MKRLAEVHYICGNPLCGNLTTERHREGAKVRERQQRRCPSCRKRTWHHRWCRFPITGRARRAS